MSALLLLFITFFNFAFGLNHTLNLTGNLSTEIPEGINILQEICVFGSHHSFLDGTYQFVAWNNDVNGPIYYDAEEHKYLYPFIEGIAYEWQLHEDYLSEHSYSYCDTMVSDPLRFYVQHCTEWKTDIDQSPQYELWEDDEFVTVRGCDHDAADQWSVTFEIETVWNEDNGVISMTLYWELLYPLKYKCTIYPTHYDGDYSCNTVLTAIKCASDIEQRPYQYGLQLDVFVDDEEHDVDAPETEPLIIQSLTIKYVEGNHVRDIHKIDHFCHELSNTSTQCDEEIALENHTLITFDYVYTGSYLDELDGEVHHEQKLTQCIPEGYDTTSDRYILVPEKRDWSSADGYCRDNFNAALATIITEDELLGAVALREANHSMEDIWIGLNDLENHVVWKWSDGTSCTYTMTEVCEDDPNWAHGKPDGPAFAWCAEMSGVNAHGHFNDDVCSGEHIFLCNYPTASPTLMPTESPTRPPTHVVHSDNIILTNHWHITERWIAFKIEHEDLSCGGSISSVEISDEYPYEGYIWYHYTSRDEEGFYIFDLNITFHPPISVRIEREYIDGPTKSNETIIGSHVIIQFKGGEHFDFERNFCVQKEVIGHTEINRTFYFLMGSLIGFFIILSFLAFMDAHFFRKNDHFQITAIISSLFQLCDMVSDVFFAVEVFSAYQVNEDYRETQFLSIFCLSIVFIVSPIFISLYQLWRSSTGEWLQDNRIREWLKTYSKLLYMSSIFTGSSFNAIQIFNSNLFGLDVFYMGLNKNHIIIFSTKKLFSIILFENVPQLVLSVWYMTILGRLSYIPLAQIAFSLISIIVTIITIMLQTRIEKTQDFISINMDVTDQCIMENRKIVKNKTNDLKKYLARNVLGVNAKWIEIQKPYGGSTRNGLRFQIYISFIHKETNKETLENHYKYLLEKAVDDGSLPKFMQNAWNLETVPSIGAINCKFLETELKRQETLKNVFNPNSKIGKKRKKKDKMHSVYTDDDIYDDTDDDEGAYLQKNNNTFIEQWKAVTNKNESNTELVENGKD